MKFTKTKNEILSRLPSKLVERLMDFQKEGVQFAVNKNGRCLIADEMGLGKTLQAISVAYYYRSEWPLLIIVPSSLRYCWIEEFEKWLPDINPGEINLIQSGNDASGIGGASVTITTFGLLSKSTSNVVREALLSQGFQVVIVDESHYIRNVKTVSAKTVVPLIKNANRRILLSGTPALARPVELYPQIDAVCPDVFGSWWSYTSKYCDARLEWIGKVKRRNVNGASNLEELQQRLSSTLMIRREKNDVLTQLPPKQRQKVLFELKDSDLKKDIRKTFEELRPLMKKSQEVFEVLTGAGDHDAKDTNMLSMIQRLYRLSGEAKIGPAKEYIEMLCENPKLKFLVFAYHHSMMNGLSQSLYDKKIKFIRIDGETPPAERPQLVHQFQSDPDTRVAVLSILAAGVGLTLTAATVVVFAEMYWTPGMMVQCEDRAHRIGQTACVAVHYLVAKDTMDEWVWAAVCKKTIVTSTALTGKKQALKADAGDKYQVDVLSRADVWIPKDNQELDLTNYFQTQLDTNQKSIRSFFSPSQTTNQQSSQSPSTSIARSSLLRIQQENLSPLSRNQVPNISSHTPSTNPSKRARLESPNNKFSTPPSENALIVIDSGSDGDFDERKLSRKSVHKSSKKTSEKGSRKRKRNDKKIPLSPSTPKCNLVSMFSKARNKDGSSIVSSDSEKEVSEYEDGIMGNPTDSEDGGETVMSAIKRDRNKIVSVSTSLTHAPGSSKRLKNQCAKIGGNAIPVCDDISTNQSIDKSCDLMIQWSCTACTFFNHKDVNCCEICETPKKSNNNKAIKHKQTAGASYSDQKVEQFNKNENIFKSKSTKLDLESSVCLDKKRREHSMSDSDSLPEGDDDIETYESPQNSDDDDPYIEDLDIEYLPSPGPSEGPLGPSEEDTPGPTEGPSRKEILIENRFSSKSDSVTKNVETPSVSCMSPSASQNKYRFKSIQRKSNMVPGITSPACSPISKATDSENSNLINADKLQSVGRSCKEGEERQVRNVTGTLEATPASATENYSFSSPELEQFYDQAGVKDKGKSADAVRKSSPEKRIVNIDNIPIHSGFRYICSKYTGRIYLHTHDDVPLNVNLVPVDIELENYDGLPDLLLHPNNLRLVQKFVREWQSLTETKRRLIIKSGRTFVSPLREYDELRSCKTINTQRHKTKGDTTLAAMKKAAEVNGSVRVISNNIGGNGQNEDIDKGITQAVSADGTPLCLQCFKPYENHLLQKSSIMNEDNAWQTRFCSQKCSQEYWMVTNNDYMRDKVYDAEHGICQMCNFDAHSLFRQVRDTKDLQKRAEVIAKSKLNCLTVKTKQLMVKKPVAGQFWHVDHIIPVWEGGGQCDIDNLRTLCIPCHQKITAKQAGKRATVRKLGAAVNSGDITAFFQRM